MNDQYAGGALSEFADIRANLERPESDDATALSEYRAVARRLLAAIDQRDAQIRRLRRSFDVLLESNSHHRAPWYIRAIRWCVGDPDRPVTQRRCIRVCSCDDQRDKCK